MPAGVGIALWNAGKRGLPALSVALLDATERNITFAAIWTNTQETMEEPLLNAHNKQEYPPMHTAEHILNRAMDNAFGCGRAVSAHVERKKSKLDFALPKPPAEEELLRVEEEVNRVIRQGLPVTMEYATQAEAAKKFDLGRLPEGAADRVRIVRVGNYDDCLCIGAHVANTAEVGTFRIASHDYKDGILRIRFKLEGCKENPLPHGGKA